MRGLVAFAVGNVQQLGEAGPRGDEGGQRHEPLSLLVSGMKERIVGQAVHVDAREQSRHVPAVLGAELVGELE